jgi:hypothetical protein
MSKFKLAPIKHWNIGRSKAVSPARRALLLGNASFTSIVATICKEARVFRISREIGTKTKRGKHRYVVTLTVASSTIDLCHNSRGGYRAQYYVGSKLGDAANTYAVEVLAALAGRLIQDDSRRRKHWAQAARSICHPQSRIWIYQGLWLRHAKLTDRLLHASGWCPFNENSSERERKLVNWGALIPKDETKLVLKGQWLRNDDGRAVTAPPKVSRANEIRRFGFT